MAAIIAVTTADKLGEFTVAPTTLTGTDSLVYKPNVNQLLTIRNTGGAPINVVLDGDAVTTVNLPGQGRAVNNAAGYTIAVAAGAQVSCMLSTIRNFLAGTVAVTGGTATSQAWITEG